MEDIFQNLDVSRLSSDEIVVFSPGLEAINKHAEENNMTISVLDVKHKRSGPVIDFWIHGGGDEDAVDDIFEEAMIRTES